MRWSGGFDDLSGSCYGFDTGVMIILLVVLLIVTTVTLVGLVVVMLEVTLETVAVVVTDGYGGGYCNSVRCAN